MSLHGRLVLVVLAVFAVSGCSTVSNTLGIGNEAVADYRGSKSVPDLEVPPDLSSTAIDDAMVVPDESVSASELSAIEAQGRKTTGVQAVLPSTPTIGVERDGDKRWLVIQADAASIWPKVRDFWLDSGFLIKREDPSIGIMETDWAENRADIPGGPIRDLLKKSFDLIYSSTTRDKFRVRLERGTRPGTTELFLTHRGVEEVEPTSDVASSPENSVWQSRPVDPELEMEMLSRLMIYMGIEEADARAEIAAAQPKPPRAHISRGADGDVVLTIDEELRRAWRTTGLALDRVGFTVEDRNRDEQIYIVRYDDPLKEHNAEGILARMSFWKDEEVVEDNQYRVKLEAAGERTQVTVVDEAGNRNRSSTAGRILSLIYEQLK